MDVQQESNENVQKRESIFLDDDILNWDMHAVEWPLRYGLAQADWLPAKHSDSELLSKVKNWMSNIW